MDQVLEVTLLVTQTLERLGIPYLVGGSLASSLHGIPRATQDVDIVAAVRREHVASLVAALQASFYIDAEMIREAIGRGSSFNVIHLASLFKVDLFVARDDVPAHQQMERRQTHVISEQPRRELMVASPEDTVLHKLRWYRMGDEVGERQWSDVLGVLRVRGAALDAEYLLRTAALMGVADLLERALGEAGMR
ncbi:MAG: nucleotidyl transferase AbiEii/AbiGii toxin family protein [Candidatus Latescibacterota bacterium]